MNKKTIKNILTSILILTLAIALSFAFDLFKMRIENIFLLGIIAILIILIETKSIINGIISSIIFVLLCNFFFTDPRLTLAVYDPKIITSFIIFFIVALIVGTLTIRLQNEVEVSKKNEKRIKALYDISDYLLNISINDEIYQFIQSYFIEYLHREVNVIKYEDFKENHELFKEYQKEIEYATTMGVTCGYHRDKYKDSKYLFFPIKSDKKVYGIILIACKQNDLIQEEYEFVKNCCNQLLLILERKRISDEQEISKMVINKEKFQTTLLRSLSHDLRTPLTSIQGNSNFIVENYNKIDESSIKNMIYDIYLESCDLSSFVENLLNMSRFEINNNVINKKKELIDDILVEVNDKVKRRLGKKAFEILSTKEMLYVYTDSRLLIQVLMNIIDNAIKHTTENTKITLSYQEVKEGIVFEISDNGGGVKQEEINRLLNGELVLEGNKDNNRNFGIGITICNAIVKAHGGSISCYNNDQKGASFQIYLPNK